MNVRTGSTQRDTGGAFTLVELLLAVALLVLLLGAVVFNFSGFQRGAPLDEGVNQIEALIRYARAQAASSGKRLQLGFEESDDNTFVAANGPLRLLWEPDPIARPGLFEPLAEAEEYVRGLTELIRIESVRLIEGNNFEPNSDDTSGVPDESVETGSILAPFPPVAFFPDGSSDSAEILVASRSEEDSRRIAVRLQGLTGTIRRKLIANELKAAEAESSAQPSGVRQPAEPIPVR